MEIKDCQRWIAEYYESRGWTDLDIFIRVSFLSEETGEVARAIRTLEIGRDRPDEGASSFTEGRKHLTEELGDVLGNVVIIANKYKIDLEEIFLEHKKKLSDRYC